jgi:hypothetical protein
MSALVGDAMAAVKPIRAAAVCTAVMRAPAAAWVTDEAGADFWSVSVLMKVPLLCCAVADEAAGAGSPQG